MNSARHPRLLHTVLAIALAALVVTVLVPAVVPGAPVWKKVLAAMFSVGLGLRLGDLVSLRRWGYWRDWLEMLPLTLTLISVLGLPALWAIGLAVVTSLGNGWRLRKRQV